MPRALFLSPHFDDVAFSCGATLHALARSGWDVVLCTVFTRSVPQPVGFALACQLDKGLGPEVDYLALRRLEDDAAAAALGATGVLRLDLPEAPHRGYERAAALFGEFGANDDVAPRLAALVEPFLRGADAVFAPQALGAHVDHRRVRDAVLAHGDASGAGTAPRTYWYRDLPYAIEHPGAATCAAVSALPELPYALSGAALAAKLDACACYSSQLAFQFGHAIEMRRALGSFARAEAQRFQRREPVEVFRSDVPLP